MATSESDIKKELKAHIDKEGSAYSKWYVGITNDSDRRLEEHNVDTAKGKSWWITRTASTDEISRRVEQYFIDMGTDGGEGGGDENSKTVYAYKKTSTTNP